jgi:response regulator RpfG family c-di-GMP phosphodiesterase
MTLSLEVAATKIDSQDEAGTYRILLVDDESGIRQSLSTYLEHHGFEVETAEDAMTAFASFRRQRPDMVLTDISMPGASGLDLLQQIKEKDGSVEVIMITAYLDISFAIQAMRRGAFDFFTKPFNFEKILLTIERARERQSLRRQAEEYAALKRQKAFEQQAIIETALGFARAVEERDKFNIGHGQRTAVFSRMLGEALELDEDHLKNLFYAALLHDVGKIGIDDAILNKPMSLTEEEYAAIKRHPELGDYVLRPISFFTDIRKAVRHHHERWDGAGYPDGIAGEEIPLDARILSIADYFDSITSARPYRSPMSDADAIELIRSESGRIFDPALVEVFLEALAKRLKSAG